jgi:WD40 repeat protein
MPVPRALLALLLCPVGAWAAGPGPRLDAFGDPLPAGARARLGSLRLRHAGWAAGALFSGDGKMLLTGNEDNAVRLWEVATGKPLGVLRAGDLGLQALALSADGKTLAAGGYRGIVLWDLPARKTLRTLKAGSVQSLAFTPDGKTLVSGGAEHASAIRVWDLATGKERRRMLWHSRAVTSLHVARDNRTLLSVGAVGDKVLLADLVTGKEIRTFSDRSWVDLHLALLTPDGKSLVLGGSRWVKGGGRVEGFLDVHDPATGSRLRSLPGHERRVTAGVLTADGKTLITSDYGRTVRVIDLQTGLEVRKWQGPGLVRRLSPDGKTLALSGRGGTLFLCDLATGKPRHDYPGHHGAVSSLAFAPDGRTLASCSYDEPVVRIWDLARARQARTLTGHEGDAVYLRAVRFVPGSGAVLTGASDSTLRLWHPGTGKELRRYRLRGRQQVLAFHVSADGKRLACASMGFSEDAPQTFTVFDVTTAKEVLRREEKGGKAFVSWPAFAPDGRTLAQQDSREVVLRRLDSGKEVLRLRAADHLEDPIVFSADGKALAVYSSTPKRSGPRFWRDDYKVRLFETATGKEKGAVALGGWGYALAFAPGGRTVAVAVERTVWVCDPAAGKVLWRSPDLDARPTSLAFAPDGKVLASGLSNGTILLWPVPPGERRASGPLSSGKESP